LDFRYLAHRGNGAHRLKFATLRLSARQEGGDAGGDGQCEPMTSEHNGEPGTVLSGSAINPQYEHQS
jgi:hypothetical protein